MDLVSGLRFVLALVVVLGLIAALAWILRRYGAGRVTLGATKGRLGVVEASHIDAKRRLVLIRRDGVEHLLLLGPTSETVIETGIKADTTPDFSAHLDATQNLDAGGAQ
jgi:flagellar protein FliO/FliZ